MANQSYREQRDVERRFVRVELAERWVSVVGQVILLALTVGLGVAAIICALRGTAWPVPAGAGGSSVLIGVAAAAKDRRRGNSD